MATKVHICDFLSNDEIDELQSITPDQSYDVCLKKVRTQKQLWTFSSPDGNMAYFTDSNDKSIHQSFWPGENYIKFFQAANTFEIIKSLIITSIDIDNLIQLQINYPKNIKIRFYAFDEIITFKTIEDFTKTILRVPPNTSFAYSFN